MLYFTDKETFLSTIRRLEREHNAGAVTTYNDTFDNTAWIIAEVIIGITKGRVGASSDYALTPAGLGMQTFGDY